MLQNVLRARSKVMHGVAAVTTCQLTVGGSMSRSCKRRFLLVLYAYLCVALLILLNLCIIDTLCHAGAQLFALPGTTVP